MLCARQRLFKLVSGWTREVCTAKMEGQRKQQLRGILKDSTMEGEKSQ